MVPKRKIGKTDIECGALGVGCNRLLDPTNSDMVKVVHEAIDLGMNMFDGADMYGEGRCEEFLGTVLKNRRNEACIVSKFGVVREPGAQTSTIDVTPAYVKQACNASLQRLGMDHIDLYYQHRMNPAVPIEDTIGAMSELVRAGKVRAIGMCNTTPDLVRRAHQVHPISAVQMEYSLMARAMEEEMLPTCKELGITFVAYGPLTYAFLTGEVKAHADLPQTDMFRRRQSRFEENNLKHNYNLLDVVNGIAVELRATPAQIALAWCLHRPYDVVPIPGSSRPKHLGENAKAATIKLSADQVRRLDRAFAPGAAKGDGGGALSPTRAPG